ncbi:MAG: metallophosphoesterase [Nitrososphaeria archaeon]|nr:metallophosphoesterase [Nitrososphaeria archaeon]
MTKRLKIVEPWPALILDESILVVSDLHFGIEEELEAEGIHVPSSLAPKIINFIIKPVKELSLNEVLILGDVKHEFGYPSPSEWISTKKLISSLKELNVKLRVVRGNHDNYIITIFKEFNVELIQPYTIIGDMTFTHGHIPEEELNTTNFIIVGHEHPSIAIRDKLGHIHRFKCLLYGKVDKKTLIVLPSLSPAAYGTDINLNPSSTFLSPFLRNKNISEMTPYAIEPGKGVQKFPKLKYII